jgi:hypothetical protein
MQWIAKNLGSSVKQNLGSNISGGRREDRSMATAEATLAMEEAAGEAIFSPI